MQSFTLCITYLLTHVLEGDPHGMAGEAFGVQDQQVLEVLAEHLAQAEDLYMCIDRCVNKYSTV